MSVSREDDIFVQKDKLLEVMRTRYFNLMEKYSSYRREELEKCGIPLREQWERLKRELLSTCDIERIDYKLDLQDEKKIGKAKVVKPVVTMTEVMKDVRIK